MKHTAFFGDAEYTFALTDDMIRELEHKTGVGVGGLYVRVINSQFHVADIIEIIRLGLIGGGAAPVTAQRLVDSYAKNRPFEETFPLALDILDARWTGAPEKRAAIDAELHHAAASGDLAAAINAGLEQVAA
jgi:hypothetical protein